ncbi:MAG: PD-(D/E)XK nuclease family protein [Opitutales bacterium]|nr:PD-(D/E)XK nuclease family protein [Opitutales bacterium]
MDRQQYQCLHPQQALVEVIFPWVERHNAAWKGSVCGRATVVVPTKGVSLWLREQLSDKYGAVFDLEILTPTLLRNRLKSGIKRLGFQNMQWQQPEDVRLLVRSILGARSEYLSFDNAKGWTRLYQDLDRVGYIPDWLPKEMLVLMSELQGHFLELDLVSESRFDRSLLDYALGSTDGTESFFDNLLIYGFGPRDLSGINFLLACGLLSRATSIVHGPPALYSGEEPWFNTWEKYFGPIDMFHVEQSHPHQLLGESIREGSPVFNADPSLDGLVSYVDQVEQEPLIQTCVLEICGIIQNAKTPRIMVLFPSIRGEGKQELKTALERLNIPYFDRSHGVVNRWTGVPEWWRYWLQFQISPTVDSYLSFAQSSFEVSGISHEALKLLESLIREGFQILQTTDWIVVEKHVHQALGYRTGASSSQLLGFIDRWSLLNEQATIGVFTQTIEDLLLRVDITIDDFDLEGITELLEQWRNCEIEVTRQVFFDWLHARLEQLYSRTSFASDTPGAVVQLCDQREVMTEPWTHVIVFDCAGASWHQTETTQGLLSEAQRRRLSEGAAASSDTHILAPGRIPVQDAKLRNEAISRLFFEVLMQPLERVLFLHQRRLPDSPAVDREPLDWLEAWFTGRSSPASLVVLPEQQTDTKLPVVCALEYLQTAVNERNTSEKPFGIYDYGAVSTPLFNGAIPAKSIEFIIKDPVAGWYHDVLGYTAHERFQFVDQRRLVDGMRLHRWLDYSRGSDPILIPLPAQADWLAHAYTNAEKEYDYARQIYDSGGGALPDWWHHLWWSQKAAVRRYIDRVAGLTSEGVWSFAGFEVSLPTGVRIGLGTPEVLSISGRIDLVLADSEALPSPQNPNPSGRYLVIDFKSGTRNAITEKSLLRGEHLQLVVYAAALSALKAEDVGILVVDRLGDGKTYSIETGTDENLEMFLAGVRTLIKRGLLGPKPCINREFSFSRPYPIAHVEIDDKILTERWNLTHPLLTSLVK